jgi:uncharacterized protein YcfL
MRKFLLLITTLSIVVLASCRSHKTCPTYNGTDKCDKTQKLEPW